MKFPHLSSKNNNGSGDANDGTTKRIMAFADVRRPWTFKQGPCEDATDDHPTTVEIPSGYHNGVVGAAAGSSGELPSGGGGNVMMCSNSCSNSALALRRIPEHPSPRRLSDNYPSSGSDDDGSTTSGHGMSGRHNSYLSEDSGAARKVFGVPGRKRRQGPVPRRASDSGRDSGHDNNNNGLPNEDGFNVRAAFEKEHKGELFFLYC